MKRNTIHRLTALLFAAAMAAALPISASAAVQYMPDVTAEMSKPAFWSDRMNAPETVLVSWEEIDVLNDAILHGAGTCLNDLANWSEETFDGQVYAQRLKDAALEDAKYFYAQGCKYDLDGSTLSD